MSNLYRPRIGLHISFSRIGRPIVGINTMLTDAWMWKLGLRPDPDIPFRGLFVSKFRYFVFAVRDRRTTPSSTACFSTSCPGSSTFCSLKQPWRTNRQWVPGRTPAQSTTTNWPMTWWRRWPLHHSRSRKERTPWWRQCIPWEQRQSVRQCRRGESNQCWSCRSIDEMVTVMQWTQRWRNYDGRNGDGNVI